MNPLSIPEIREFKYRVFHHPSIMHIHSPSAHYPNIQTSIIIIRVSKPNILYAST